jgi:hypothetical protein
MFLMLTRIVQPSPALETFLGSLHLNLSQPQREHLLHFVDGLVACDERKTLAALQRQFLDATDPSNWADFLRISPWSVAEVRDSLRRHQVTWLLELAQARGLPKVLYINLEDSLGKKDKHTSQIEPVDWFHDHNESTPRQPRYHTTDALTVIGCTSKKAKMAPRGRWCHHVGNRCRIRRRLGSMLKSLRWTRRSVDPPFSAPGGGARG